MKETEVSRRGAIGGMLGCLMGPLIPAISLPKEQPKKKADTFYVLHRRITSDESAIIRGDYSIKIYRESSVVTQVLRLLFDDDREYDARELEWGLLAFLWDRHDHEASLIQDGPEAQGV